MLLLLPPSEGKTPPSEGAGLNLDSLAFPELNEHRKRVADALAVTAQRDDALTLLGLGQRVAAEVSDQRNVWSLPCAPAWQVYSGVLYDAARISETDVMSDTSADNGGAHPRRHAGHQLLIASGLLGITRASDLIPAYRLPMGATLDGLGKIAPRWRKALAAITVDSPGTVDVRSGSYKVWNPSGPRWDVRIVDSRGRVVSHWAKQYRGQLVRALLDSPDAAFDDVPDVARAVGDVAVTRGRGALQTLTIAVAR